MLHYRHVSVALSDGVRPAGPEPNTLADLWAGICGCCAMQMAHGFSYSQDTALHHSIADQRMIYTATRLQAW
jgi:hypothetical protein